VDAEQVEIPFVGPSYELRSITADAQRSVNLYLETIESEDGESQKQLIGTWGYTTFLTLPTYPIRKHWEVNGRLFVVSGNTLYEVAATGIFNVTGGVGSKFNAIGTLNTASGPIGMRDNGFQLCIVDGNNEYIYQLLAGQVTNPANEQTTTIAPGTWLVNPAGGEFFGSYTVAFIDGYFVFSQPLSNQFQLSQLFDGTNMSDLDIAQKEGYSDYIVQVFNDHDELYLFGSETTEPWYDSGSNSFPFVKIPGIFIEKGTVAAETVQQFDNTIFFMGKDKRGAGIIYRLNGFTPVRVSTYAVENALRSYGDLTGCTAYTYQEAGHDFYCVNAPNGKSTWCFDAGEKQWHERQYYNPKSRRYERDRIQYHTYVWGLHICSDYQTGQLYVASIDTLSHDGADIHRIRISPHLRQALKRIFYYMFQVDMEVGIGLDGGVQGEDPQAMLQVSNDGGKTWGKERWKTIGALGETLTRVLWRKLGKARHRVWKLVITDQIRVTILGAVVESKIGKN
jgi:hypothetical protein